MRLRNIPEAKPYLAAHPLVADSADDFSVRLKRAVLEFKQIHLEIGVGKGRFMRQKCLAYPDIFFAGIEHYSSVLYKAVQKFDADCFKNALFICEDAQRLDALINDIKIDVIYINFPDPWPKARHSHRRLLCGRYLESYKRLLKDNGKLYFKTDNKALFVFARNSLIEASFKIDDISYDLHHINGFFEDNIVTEYEQRFSERGQRIYALKAEWRKAIFSSEWRQL